MGTILFLGILLAQQPDVSIPGMPELRVELGLNATGQIESLLVYQGQQLMQTLEVCTAGPVALTYPAGSLAMADYNFDGFSDLALQVTAEKDNKHFCVWLFDPQQKRFKASSQLSRLTNPIPDPKNRTVVSTKYEACAYCYEKQEFRWSGKQLEMVRQESLTMDPLANGSGGCDYVLTVKRRKHGEMRETGRDRTTSFGAPCPDSFWHDRIGIPGSLDR